MRVFLIFVFLILASVAPAQFDSVPGQEDEKPLPTPTLAPMPDDYLSTWTLASLFAGGDGSEAKPFVIKNAEQLGYAMRYRGEHFVMLDESCSLVRLDFAPPKDLSGVETRLLRVSDTDKTALKSVDLATTGALLTATKTEAETVDEKVATKPAGWSLIRECWVYLKPLSTQEVTR